MDGKLIRTDGGSAILGSGPITGNGQDRPEKGTGKTLIVSGFA